MPFTDTITLILLSERITILSFTGSITCPFPCIWAFTNASLISFLLSYVAFILLFVLLQTWFGNQPWKSYGIQMVPLTPASELRDDPAWIEEMLPLFEESCMKDDGKSAIRACSL